MAIVDPRMVVRRIPVHTQSILTWYSVPMQDLMSHRIMSPSVLVLYTLGIVCTGETVILGLPTDGSNKTHAAVIPGRKNQNLVASNIQCWYRRTARRLLYQR